MAGATHYNTLEMSIKLYFRAVCPKQGFAECLDVFREMSWNKYKKLFNNSENFQINFEIHLLPRFFPAIGNTRVMTVQCQPLLCLFLFS